MKRTVKTDILIVGAGIVGLSIARELSERHSGLDIKLVDKETALASHASGRNSGVIHAGFYYSPDSMKARLTAEGNRLLTGYCLENGIAINRCGKVVVAADEGELKTLMELKKRGEKNGVPLDLVDAKELGSIEPNAATYEKALFSPTTSSVNPREVVEHIAAALKKTEGVEICCNEKFLNKSGPSSIETSTMRIEFAHLINAAGLYADKVAHRFGVGTKYTLIPFKGLYMEYRDDAILGRHVYPVPNLSNPFLGVHFTKTVDGKVKIGPTATPAFWRENYKGAENFNFNELVEILGYEARLFLTNSFNFRSHTIEELKKYYGRYLVEQASRLVKSIDPAGFGGYTRPGIRAQLLDTEKMRLVMDFVVEEGENSTHVLNAVSPAFTCAFSFRKLVADSVERSC